MKKLREKEPAYKGEITAFLALIFILMLSVVGALIESASIQITRSRKRADTLLALESVFAEYDRKMLDEYDLFVHRGSEVYEISRRLSYYGADNMTHSLEQVELLTDHFGEPFFRQAVRYMKNWIGMEEDVGGSGTESGDSGSGSHGQLDSGMDFATDGSIEQEEADVTQQLQGLLEQEEATLPQENNPLSDVQRLKDTDLITLVAPEAESLSENSMDVSTLPSRRNLQQGNFGEEVEKSLADKAFFHAYLAEHFGSMTDSKEGRALLYETEYLLGGYASDKENLEAVCEKILNIRMVANYTYLLTDSTKQAEAEAVATALCSLLTVPEISQLVKHLLLFGWAYGEGIVDLRSLLKGERVPLMKTSETWQLQLANLGKLGTSEEVSGEKDFTSGLSYEDYLKALLLTEKVDVLCMRSLDLIESHLGIKTDDCMTKAKIKTKLTLRRGVRDSFTTMFGYQ